MISSRLQECPQNKDYWVENAPEVSNNLHLFCLYTYILEWFLLKGPNTNRFIHAERCLDFLLIFSGTAHNNNNRQPSWILGKKQLFLFPVFWDRNCMRTRSGLEITGGQQSDTAEFTFWLSENRFWRSFWLPRFLFYQLFKLKFVTNTYVFSKIHTCI